MIYKFEFNLCGIMGSQAEGDKILTAWIQVGNRYAK